MPDPVNTAQNRAAEAGSTQPRSDLLRIAGQAFDASTAYVDANLRPQWERNIRAFHSRHPVGSKYYSDDYKHRSKLFRPKTRAAVRSGEAAAAAAFFATENVCSVDPGNDADPRQLASARTNKALLQYRLTRTIPWFQTVIGACQDSQIYGFVVSKQTWLFDEVLDGEEEVQEIDEVTGAPKVEGGVPFTVNSETVVVGGRPVMQRVPRWRVVKDEPDLQLIPPENLRIDPGADWRDPIQSSPYLIVLIPMYVCDLKAKMRQPDGKAGGAWNHVDDAVLAQARENTPDQTKQVREQNRQAPSEASTGVSDFDLIWLRETFLRIGGVDTHFLSVKDLAFLTDPKPIREVYQQDERPYVMGFGMIEAHRPFPQSKVEILQDLQTAANETANQRMDNVRLSMNGRHFVRAGKGVDLAALKKSVPGGIVLMRDPRNDVVTERPSDVTSSAYAEQDRLNVDFDELAGTFSPSSVQTSRQLNETVGGMQMLSGHASAMVEFDLRTFAETWAEPALQQLVRLEQRYESDPVVLALAGQKAELWKHGISVIDDDLLNQDVTISVNVGVGATDPTQRMNKLAAALKMVAELIGPEMAKRLNIEEIITEVFGAAGYKDGHRFFNFEESDPRYAQLLSALQEMEQVIAKLKDENAAKLAIEDKRIEGQIKLKAMDRRMDVQGKAALAEQGFQHDLAAGDAAARRDWQLELARTITQSISQAIAPALAERGRGGTAPVVLDSQTGQIRDLGEMQAGWQQTAAMMQAGMEQMFGRLQAVLGDFADELERQRMQAEADSVDVRRRLAEVSTELTDVTAEIARQREDTEAWSAEQRAQLEEFAARFDAPRQRRIGNIERDGQGRMTGAEIVDASGAVVARASLSRDRSGRVDGGTISDR
jgi:hypothetical protein